MQKILREEVGLHVDFSKVREFFSQNDWKAHDLDHPIRWLGIACDVATLLGLDLVQELYIEIY